MGKKDFQQFLLKDDVTSDWLGEVVDNADPEFAGRCRVRIFGKFDGSSDPDVSTSEIPDDQLPWAYPTGSAIFGGGEEHGAGFLSVPKIGAKVKVRFSGGNIYAPEYFAVQDINAKVIEEVKDSYQNAHVLFYDEDEEVKIVYTSAKGLEMFHKDSHIVINPDSRITIEHKNSESIIELVGTNINIVCNSNVEITAKNNVTVFARETATITANTAIVDAKHIELGKDAAESVIKGDAFKEYNDAHVHIGNLGAPTGPPTIPIPDSLLSKITKTK